MGCWLPVVGMGLLLILGACLSGGRGFIIWVSVTGGWDTALHYLAALFAVMTAAGEQRRVRSTNITAIFLIFVGFFALNLSSITVAGLLVYFAGKIRMQKLLWRKPIPQQQKLNSP